MTKKITRREFVKKTAVATVGAACSDIFLSCNNDRNISSGKYNVLLIALDDVNDWVGCLGGNSQAQTPNIDKFAKQAALFSNAHCTSTPCNPSRVSMLTGIPPTISGIYENSQEWRKSETLKDAITIPQYFEESSYYTFGTGKVFHNHFPDPVSWNEYWPSKEKHIPHDTLNSIKQLTISKKDFLFNWGVAEEKNLGDFRVVEKINEKLNQKIEKPFFYACGLKIAHLPWYAPKKFYDLYPISDIKLPISSNKNSSMPEYHQSIVSENKWTEAIQAYLACLSCVDYNIGRILDSLEKGPNGKDTIVVIVSDSGMHLGEKNEWKKFTLYEESTRVPFIIYHPEMKDEGGKIKPIVIDDAVSLIDLYQTLIELCNLEKKFTYGNSLAPLIKGEKISAERYAVTFSLFKELSIRTKFFRYTKYNNGIEELFDHRNDPNEDINLVSNFAYKNELENLRLIYQKEIKNGKSQS